MARRTSSSVTGRRAGSSGQTSAPTAPRRTIGPSRRRSRRTGGSWPLTVRPRTSWPATPTTYSTCSSAIGGGARPNGSASPPTAPRAMARASTRRPRRTGASSRSSRTRPTWCRATPTAVATCSSATGRPERPSSSASVPAAPRRTAAAATSGAWRSRRTGASSPSTRPPATWCRPTPTARSTSSCATARQGRRSGRACGRTGTRRTGPSALPALSKTGRFVAFVSDSSNLVLGDTNSADDAFVHDLKTGKTTRVSVASGGAQAAEGALDEVSISGDGRLIAFASRSDDLVARDGNRRSDAFVHDRLQGTTRRVSVGPDGKAGNQNSFVGAISADGRFVAFDPFATDLVPDDTNSAEDVF